MAHPVDRERKSPGPTPPAHHPTLIGYTTPRDAIHRSKHFQVDSARLWDMPEQPPPIGIAVSGEQSCRIAGELADLVIAVEPERGLIEAFDRHGGAGKPRVGQLHRVCYDKEREAAVARAHEQFR